ncbi:MULTISPECIES: Fic/DOC family protein [Sphingobium]|uniref:Fic/DOC family protein n=1 Tax=Sphingobium TaxID=165695 RepID=UPI00036CEC3C|nr:MULTISPECIES: Fic family protein [Sphingobium]
MAGKIDPYAYPGTDVLRNRLGITDGKELDRRERLITRARGNEAARMDFPLTADGYRALHKHLFQDLYEWAGQDRTVNIGKQGSLFAHAPYVANGLNAVFKELGEKNNFRGLNREEFFDRLGHHMNELNAVHPFREGNGRTMRLHAAQIAREAGHPIRIASIDERAWMDGSRHGFTTGDHRALSAVLSAAAIRRDLGPEPRTGPGGIAFLPARDPPAGQRYRMTLNKVREELEKHLPTARAEAADRVSKLTKAGASADELAKARTELAYVRHAKGPVYQSHLLSYVGSREVEAVITPKQTPLERVREIGAALAVQINMQQGAQLQRAIRALERPILPPGHSPSHERLAAAFLKNTPEKNAADPRLAPAQAIVDAAMQAARSRGDNARAIDGAGESTRKAVAAVIRSGDPLDPNAPEFRGRGTGQPQPPSPTKDKGRGR